MLGGSSDPSTVTIDGVRPTAFSWDDPSGWPAATDGVDAVYLVAPTVADAPELIAGLVADTPAHAQIVLLSEQDADSFAPGAGRCASSARSARADAAGPMLRPSWFMQVFTDARYYRDQIAGTGELPFPGGGATVAWIDARDIAAVAERALLEEGHAGRIYELSGPEALTLPRTAQALSQRAGPAGHPRGADDRGGRGRHRTDSTDEFFVRRSSACTPASSPRSPTPSSR